MTTHHKLRQILPILFVFILFFAASLPAKSQGEAKVNWLTIEEAEALNKKHPKKIFVDFYTDWCGWCKRMEANTFSHPVIAAYLNEHYYPVKFNAEQTATITFRGMEFKNDNEGQRRPPHSFAVAVLQGRMGYPSVAFFDEDLNLITALSGYRPPEGLEPILVFFNNDVYKQTSDLDGFSKNFKSAIE